MEENKSNTPNAENWTCNRLTSWYVTKWAAVTRIISHFSTGNLKMICRRAHKYLMIERAMTLFLIRYWSSISFRFTRKTIDNCQFAFNINILKSTTTTIMRNVGFHFQRTQLCSFQIISQTISKLINKTIHTPFSDPFS